MATHKIQTIANTATITSGVWQRYFAYVDSQKSYAIAWWLGSLLLHGCFLVPLTFLAVYSLGGPTLPFLFISLICFFVNVVANMGGAGFRFTFNSFLFSIATHLIMVITTVLTAL